MIKVNLDSSLDKICNNIKKKIENNANKLVEDCTKILYEEIKKECPVDTGELRDSIEYNIEKSNNSVKGTITSNKKYLIYVLYGTGKYAINGRGRNTPWTYQDSNGKWHYTLGQQPNNFFRRAFINKEGEIRRKLKRYGKY